MRYNASSDSVAGGHWICAAVEEVNGSDKADWIEVEEVLILKNEVSKL